MQMMIIESDDPGSGQAETPDRALTLLWCLRVKHALIGKVGEWAKKEGGESHQGPCFDISEND